MNSINFLPPSYFNGQRRRARLFCEAAFVAVVAVVLVVAHVIGDSGMLEQRDYAAQIKAEGTALQRQFKELAVLQEEHRKLSGQLQVHQQVTLPVSFTHVLAAVSNLAPSSIALVDVRLETKPPVPAAAKVLDDSKGKKASKARTVPVATKGADPLRIELTALSPDDGRIADFVGALAESPLFTNVKLLFSRSSELDGVVSRRFRVTMEVRLDRQYVDLNKLEKLEGVADAD